MGGRGLLPACLRGEEEERGQHPWRKERRALVLCLLHAGEEGMKKRVAAVGYSGKKGEKKKRERLDIYRWLLWLGLRSNWAFRWALVLG